MNSGLLPFPDLLDEPQNVIRIGTDAISCIITNINLVFFQDGMKFILAKKCRI